MNPAISQTIFLREVLFVTPGVLQAQKWYATQIYITAGTYSEVQCLNGFGP